MRELSQAELEATVKAARRAGRGIGPEDRFDLRQELRIILAQRPPPDDLDAALFTWAKNWVGHFLDSRRAERAMLKQIHAAGTAPTRYRVGANWEPSWYAPVAESRRGLDGSPSTHAPEPECNAPFACKGARVMHVKAASHSVDMENLYVEVFNYKR